jgi:hypothetical protein
LLPDLAATRYLDNTSTVRGKPSIVVEAGDAGVVEADDVALLVDGTLNTMRARKMLSGDPRPNPVWLDRTVDVLFDGPGVWYPLVKRGERDTSRHGPVPHRRWSNPKHVPSSLLAMNPSRCQFTGLSLSLVNRERSSFHAAQH